MGPELIIIDIILLFIFTEIIYLGLAKFINNKLGFWAAAITKIVSLSIAIPLAIVAEAIIIEFSKIDFVSIFNILIDNLFIIGIIIIAIIGFCIWVLVNQLIVNRFLIRE